MSIEFKAPTEAQLADMNLYSQHLEEAFKVLNKYVPSRDLMLAVDQMKISLWAFNASIMSGAPLKESDDEKPLEGELMLNPASDAVN